MSRPAKQVRTTNLGTVWKVGDRWAARYDHAGSRHTPGHTFASFAMGDDWLRDESRLIDGMAGAVWRAPKDRREQAAAEAVRDATTLGEFARDWISNRTTATGHKLAPKTTREYLSYLDGRLAGLAAKPVVQIDRAMVDLWWQANDDRPPARQAAYMLLKSVMKDAVNRGMIPTNPCQIVNGSRRARVTPKQVRSQLIVNITPAEVQTLVAAMDRENFRAMLLLVAYCGLRPGEAFALTRADVRQSTAPDGLPRWTVHVHQGVSVGENGNGRAVGAPKTSDSIRTVPVPPHLAPVLADHLVRFAEPGDTGLLFPSTNPSMPFATDRQVMGTYASARTGRGRKKGVMRDATGFAAARLEIGRPSLRLYDLRHWARRMWTLAGLDYASTEMLLGHGLPMVQGTYAHLDLEHVWPYAVKVSELSGWTRPTASPTSATPAGGLMSLLTDDQLGAALAAMTPEQLVKIVPTLPAETLARLLVD